VGYEAYYPFTNGLHPQFSLFWMFADQTSKAMLMQLLITNSSNSFKAHLAPTKTIDFSKLAAERLYYWPLHMVHRSHILTKVWMWRG
jgi:hypothetical protein